MVRASALLLAPTLAGVSLAAATARVTQIIVIPQVDMQTIEASVVSAGPTATLYHLTCPKNKAGYDCGLGGGMDVLEGQSTYELHMTQDPM